MIISQTSTAVGQYGFASFLGSGGTQPYLYEVLPGGAGGTIHPTTGVYTGPAVVPDPPATTYDTIQVTDYVGTELTARILVGHPLLLFCEIIQRQMNLADGRVYLFDQKFMQPTDSGVYIAVSVPSCKPYANINKMDPETGLRSVQSLNMLATLDLDIISRSNAALWRKEELVLAFNSTYAQKQQQANGFYIGKLPPGSRFINLSEVDGAAIPYRFRISVNMQYSFQKQQAIDYFDDFESVEIETEP